MDFTDDYQNTGRVLLVYNENNTCESAKDSNVVLSHAKIVDGQLDMNSLEVLIEVNKTNRNHNGGNVLSIGNNRYVWSIGDGGGSFDPNDNGQNQSSPLGTIQLVHYENETIVPVNDTNEGSYTLHYGLRNPWRIDVDPTGNLWIADVGQHCYEEVNLVPIMQSSNFGWAERKGSTMLTKMRGAMKIDLSQTLNSKTRLFSTAIINPTAQLLEARGWIGGQNLYVMVTCMEIFVADKYGSLRTSKVIGLLLRWET